MADRVRWRLVVHALDRTGPPMLLLAAARWIAEHVPEVDLEFLAFRGGPLRDELAALGPVVVVLDHHEPWDHADPPIRRSAALRERLSALRPAAANLLVSTSAGQVLPLLDASVGPIVTWSVEVGEDLRWLDQPVGLQQRTHRWLAGSATTAAELQDRLDDRPISVIPEFVTDPRAPELDEVAACRDRLGGTDRALIVGAGIGTHRKGLDLFVEVAVASARAATGSGRPPPAFAWIGGADDPLFEPVRNQVRVLGLEQVLVLPPVADVVPWFAAADVFCHTARSDAFPLVCLHAAAVGTPVAAFAGCGGLEEMFASSFVGAAYPDTAALAATVADLVDGPRGRDAAAAQRDRVAGHYLASSAAPVLVAELRAVAPW